MNTMLNQIQEALKKSDLFWHNLAKTDNKIQLLMKWVSCIINCKMSMQLKTYLYRRNWKQNKPTTCTMVWFHKTGLDRWHKPIRKAQTVITKSTTSNSEDTIIMVTFYSRYCCPYFQKEPRMILDQNLRGERSWVHLLKVLSKYRVPMLDYVVIMYNYNSCVITWFMQVLAAITQALHAGIYG